MKRWMVLCLVLAGTRAWADSGWTSVEKALGRPGVEQGEEYRVLFPRTDLNVVVQGYPLDSANVLASRFTFKPGPMDNTKKDQVEGQLFLLDSEVSAAMAQAAKGGLEMTALYSPFLDESPCLKCLRLRGEGSRSSLAFAAKMVLSATGTPMVLPPENVEPQASPTATVTISRPNPWGEVQDLLGQGEEKGFTLLYKLESIGHEASLAFQTHGNQATVSGEFILPEGES
ncbi:MAG TPA: DUF1259 domain-containing protein, partial [bacterium]|nr:DUF1259 domain-containing protein [bacterium]